MNEIYDGDPVSPNPDDCYPDSTNPDDEGIVCSNPDDGQLVFEPRSSLTEEEKERADLHIGSCLACQTDMDFDHFFSRLVESTWETYAGS